MPTVKRRFINPHNVTHGALEVNTVQSITFRKNWTRLAGQGDNDITDTAQFKVNLQVGGTIVLQDPIQGEALIDAASATLAWESTPQAGGVAKEVSITGVEFFTLDETDSHNALDGVTLGWNAFNPSGADPVTTALAS